MKKKKYLFNKIYIYYKFNSSTRRASVEVGRRETLLLCSLCLCSSEFYKGITNEYNTQTTKEGKEHHKIYLIAIKITYNS